MLISWHWCSFPVPDLWEVTGYSAFSGYGDMDNITHRGFEAFQPLLDRWKPRYFVHGHVHLNYGTQQPRILQYGETTIINAYQKYMLEIE